MNWQFWKKQSFVVKKSKSASVLPISLDNEFYNFFPPLQMIEFDGKEYKLNSHQLLNKDIQKNSLIKELIREKIKPQMIEAEIIMKQIIIKQTVFNKLYANLDNLHKECEEEGFKQFSETAKQNAKEILQAVYKKFSDYEYYTYPTEDREIAIDCNPQKGRGILILCDSEGGVAYFSTRDGKNSRFRCDNIEDFPYKLLWQEFTELNKEQNHTSLQFCSVTNLSSTTQRERASKIPTTMSIIPVTNLSSATQKPEVYSSSTGVKYQHA